MAKIWYIAKNKFRGYKIQNYQVTRHIQLIQNFKIWQLASISSTSSGKNLKTIDLWLNRKI